MLDASAKNVAMDSKRLPLQTSQHLYLSLSHHLKLAPSAKL